MRDKVTRQCPQTTTFEEKGELKRIRTVGSLLTSLTPYRWAKPAHKAGKAKLTAANVTARTEPTLTCIIGGSCHKYYFCRDNSFVATNTSFVATNVCLSRQNICHDKHNFVVTKVLSRQKLYLWQLLPMIDMSSHPNDAAEEDTDTEMSK